MNFACQIKYASCRMSFMLILSELSILMESLMKKNHFIPLIFVTIFSANTALASVLSAMPANQATKHSLVDRVLLTINFKTPAGGIDAVDDLYASSDSSCRVHVLGPGSHTHVKTDQDCLTSKEIISLEQQLQGGAGHWGCLQVIYKYNNGLYKSPKVLLTWDGKKFISAMPSTFSIDFTKAPVK